MTIELSPIIGDTESSPAVMQPTTSAHLSYAPMYNIISQFADIDTNGTNEWINFDIYLHHQVTDPGEPPNTVESFECILCADICEAAQQCVSCDVCSFIACASCFGKIKYHAHHVRCPMCRGEGCFTHKTVSG